MTAGGEPDIRTRKHEPAGLRVASQTQTAIGRGPTRPCDDESRPRLLRSSDLRRRFGGQRIGPSKTRDVIVGGHPGAQDRPRLLRRARRWRTLTGGSPATGIGPAGTGAYPYINTPPLTPLHPHRLAGVGGSGLSWCTVPVARSKAGQ